MKEREGYPMSMVYKDELLTQGPEEVKAAIFRAWKAAGKPAANIQGPKGNVLEFYDQRGLAAFISKLPPGWEVLSPGGYAGASEVSRQRTHQKIWDDGILISFRADKVIYVAGIKGP